MGGWWRWELVSPDGVPPSRMVSVSASVNLPLHHKVQKFSRGTGSPGWSRKKDRKTAVVWWSTTITQSGSHLLTPYTPVHTLFVHKVNTCSLFHSFHTVIDSYAAPSMCNETLSKSTVALPWLLLRSILRHVILLVPFLSATIPTSPKDCPHLRFGPIG